jgi:hypothetical protein
MPRSLPERLVKPRRCPGCGQWAGNRKFLCGEYCRTCWPAVEPHLQRGVDPAAATKAKPGTAKKIAVLGLRVVRGVKPLFHPGDARWQLE